MPTEVSLVGINRSSYLYCIQDVKTYLMKAFCNNYLCLLHIVIQAFAISMYQLQAINKER